MSTPILATKLYIPPPRPTLVRRPHLLVRLNAALQHKVTLISAPAGYGKTTLVSSWIADFGFSILPGQALDFGVRPPENPSIKNQKSKIKNQVAWLSLDEGDNDPIRFLTYFVAALQTLAPQLGVGVLALLQSPQPPPLEITLTALLNEIAPLPDQVVLILDDYHLIEVKAVDQALTFLIEHLPPQMHLVITTREDPHLPLARLRAQSQLIEVRAADLRFTAAEAADFLNQVMGLSLAAADIIALEERTEGWIAGLQLAALSIQGREDVPGFIRTFAGDHRYIVDYLVEEVLQRQPEPVRSFLLQTAILDRLNGSLCDAVTGQEGSNAWLEALERGNFFVVPLDDQRHWYRYHHLFAEVLNAHLRAEQPDLIATLHQRASAWYEQHGAVDDAIRHALAAADFAHAAALVELALPAMRQRRQEATALGWLQALPADLLQCRPVLSVGYAWALLASGKLADVEARLRAAERWLETGLDAGTGAVVVDEVQFRLLPGLIALFRAGHALALGDVANTVKYAGQALDLFPAEEQLGRGAAVALLGLASWTRGDLTTAHRMYADGMAMVQRAGNLSDVISSAMALADIRIAQGRLHEAMNTYEHSLQLATAQHSAGPRPVRGTADLYVGMSELYREQNDLPTAIQHLLKSKELGERTGFPQNQSRWHVAMARIREAQGDLAGALDLLIEAERLYVSDFSPNVRPVAAVKTRLWVAQGWLGEALGWAREQGLSAHDDPSYLREFEHITLARVLLAQYQHDHVAPSLLEAMGLLTRLLQAADAGGRAGSVIEILVLQALAHQAQGNLALALVPLERALMLAGGPTGAEGYIRMFLDEGPPMAQLLGEVAARQIMPTYTNKLLAAFEGKQQPPASKAPFPIATIPTLPAAQPLIEPLSQRELEVLRLFKTELSGPEIARELMVALSTVRTHTKGIYGKLNVNSRQAAVNRAAELNLI